MGFAAELVGGVVVGGLALVLLVLELSLVLLLGWYSGLSLWWSVSELLFSSLCLLLSSWGSRLRNLPILSQIGRGLVLGLLVALLALA